MFMFYSHIWIALDLNQMQMRKQIKMFCCCCKYGISKYIWAQACEYRNSFVCNTYKPHGSY